MLYKNEKFSSHTFKDASKCHKQYSQLDQHLILSQVSSQCNSNQARILRMQTMKTTYATNTSVCNQHKCQVIRTVPTLQQNTDVRRGTNSERNTETFEGERTVEGTRRRPKGTVEGTRRRPKGNGQSKEHADVRKGTDSRRNTQTSERERTVEGTRRPTVSQTSVLQVN